MFPMPQKLSSGAPQTGLVQYFRLDETKLSRWLRTVEDSYQNNNYHNRIHAADVTHSMYVMLIRGGLHKGLSMIQILATVLATVRPPLAVSTVIVRHRG